MSDRRAHYEALVVAALDRAGVKAAMETGHPELLDVRIKSDVASDEVLLQLDFAPYPTPEERAASCMVAAAQVVDKLLEIAERERKKVARCPTCSEWFETFATRNEHREEKHRLPVAEKPAAEETLALQPENPSQTASASGGGLVEW